MSGTFSTPNALFDPGSAVAQQSSLFGSQAPLNAAPGLGAPQNALAPGAPGTPAAAPGAAADPGRTLTDQQIYDLLARTPMSEANAWAQQQNNNAFGFDTTTPQGQQQLGLAAAAGFPSFNDPRMIQSHLADIAQGTVTVPGMSPEQARAALMQQINGGWAGGYGGGEGHDRGPDIAGIL